MHNNAKERTKWKARLTAWVDESSFLLSRPVRKLMSEATVGILSSGSLQLSSIARSLKEPTSLHHTLKRLSRMLSCHDEITWAAEELLLSKLGKRVTNDMVLAIDPGDLNRDGACRSEALGRVRDGSTGEIVNGYPLMSVVARDIRRGITFPLLTRLLSSARAAYRSENTDILSVMEAVQRHVQSQPLWVIDRGGDRGKLWHTWIKDGWDVLVRATNQRFWLWRDQQKTAQQIARELPLKHRGQLTRHSKEQVRFGITSVCLREHPEHKLSMVVVRHGKREPLVLVSTRVIRGRKQGERLMQSYMDRWACEEGYRFSKQGFDLEKVQARKLSSLQNLVALANLAWGLLAYYQEQGKTLIAKAKRQKKHKVLQFPFYSLLLGWQRLFAEAKRVFYHWWRAPKTADTSPIRDLFEDTGQLVPVLR
jgi:hypothetical protein